LELTMKSRVKLAAFTVCVVACATSALLSQEKVFPRRDAVVIAVEKAAPAVVNISTEQVVVAPDPFLLPGDLFGEGYWDFFGGFPTRRYRATSLGAGVIIDRLGYIITNYHVVARASKIQVTLSDKSSHLAELLSFRQDKDIAVLKVDAGRPLPYAKLGTSGDLMPGETVIAVGNPFGLGNSVSVGVVSAIGRPYAYRGQLIYDDLIQTDASINPGNSGGPLLNVNGELVGVNMAIKAEAQGIGFAIPVDDVKVVVVELLGSRRERFLWLGLEVEEHEGGGLQVTQVNARSPAEEGGLKTGDLILSADGRTAESRLAFEAQLLNKKSGEKLALLCRRAGKELILALALKAPPKPDVKALAQNRLGIQVQNINEQVAESLGIRSDVGILVTDVDSLGPAAAVGISPGDIIAGANDDPVRKVEDFGRKLEQADDYLRLTYVRIQRRGPMAFSQTGTVSVRLR
jgi:serine protease Do